MTTARAAVEEVLSPSMAKEIWTGNYDKALPVTLQGFDLTAVLPAVFYMFRFGRRRGMGKFLETFGPAEGTPQQRKRKTTVERVAGKLAANENFVGFCSEAEKAVLGDLLLCFCLDNIRRAPGRTEQVQRVAPAHYMASWLDLPDSVGHLRQVPEMIVAMLADQAGESIEPESAGLTWFPVGKDHEQNVLLRAFRQGVECRGELSSLTADRFDESNRTVGIDQLLTVRLAQQLKSAPQKLRGSSQIPNQRPIAALASRRFSEDIRRFVRAYADVIPRRAFVEMLEPCIAVGVTAIFSSTVDILFDWSESGKILPKSKQSPSPLFMDCSNGVDRRLRSQAEQSLDDFMRRTARFPVILMTLRLLDHKARYDRKIRKRGIPTRPDAGKWLDLLGDLLHERDSEAAFMHREIDSKTEELAEKLEEDYPDAAAILRNDTGESNPFRRLAEALTSLISQSWARTNMVTMIDSILLIDRPNGLAAKRKTSRKDATTGARRQREVRSLVFTDSTLDYLVHLHLLKSGNKAGVRALSLRDFIHDLRERYGFCVDEAPPGMAVAGDLLQANRAVLERRLRDLGLLAGVNDAEAMKRLRPRFQPSPETAEED